MPLSPTPSAPGPNLAPPSLSSCVAPRPVNQAVSTGNPRQEPPNRLGQQQAASTVVRSKTHLALRRGRGEPLTEQARHFVIRGPIWRHRGVTQTRRRHQWRWPR
ncbi:hypothetical protein LY78DRAFT_228231 [Colletotrichum sublineola]|nr:hypothetical protein LY78DRAFT_228231 [Colletotrichum sublineola]